MFGNSDSRTYISQKIKDAGGQSDRSVGYLNGWECCVTCHRFYKKGKDVIKFKDEKSLKEAIEICLASE